MEEEEKKHRTKRQLNWPVYRKKEDIKMLAKVKIRFIRFIKWEEFLEVLINLISILPFRKVC